MSDSDRRHNCSGIVVIILLTVAIFTIFMTSVWVLGSNRTTAKGSVHHTTSDGPVARDHGLMLASNATHNMAREQERVRNATQAAIQGPAKDRTPRHRAEYSRVTARNDIAVFQDSQFEIGPAISKNRAPVFVVRGKSITKIPHSIHHRSGHTSTVVDGNLNNDTDTSQVLREMNIRLNHRQMNNYGYPTIQKDETVAHTDVLNNNKNAYDLTYDVNEKDSNENKNSINRNSWTTFFNRLRQIIPKGLWLFETPEISGSSDQPPFRLGAHYQDKKYMEYKFKQYDVNSNLKIPEGQLLKHISPTYKIDFMNQPILDTKQDSLILQHSESIPAVQDNMSSSPQPAMLEVPIINEILWRRIALMAFMKLGLVKLKVIGFIKILYFLLFKLKFVLIVLFLKFFSLLKFIKFSSLPLLFLPLAAIIFLVAMKTFPAYTSLMLNNNNNNPSISSTTNAPIPNNEEVIHFPDETIKLTEEIVSTPGQNVMVPTVQQILVPTSQTIVDSSEQIENLVVPPGRIQINPSSNVPPNVIQVFNNLGQLFEPIKVMDPTLDLFQMELNSEKCVERIACKIATTGKTGIIPLWINWVLHQESKPVPNDKLLHYLKAYHDVINEIHMKSPNPDNWETWCFERFDCNNTDTK